MTDYSNKRKADCLIDDPTDGDDEAVAFEILSNIVSEHIQTSNDRMERLEEATNERMKILEDAFLALTQKVEDCSTNMNTVGVTSNEEEDEDISDDEESVIDERDQWSKMYRLLREYRIGNGNCNVSKKENPKLYTWAKNQRTAYTNAKFGKVGIKLKPEKIAKLESIGFTWGSKFPSPPTWDEMFEQLKLYKQRFNNCDVPINPTTLTPLAKWVVEQRKQYKYYKYGRPSFITLDQIGKLQDLGLKWKGPKL